jgi:putative FmdB family regulatory protein
MPIFDYACNCGETVSDKLVRSSDTPVECSKCGAQMKKQLCATKNVLLMGDGFYKPHDQNKIKADKQWI